MSSWEDAVTWLRNQPDQRQLVLDAFYDDPLISAAERYFECAEWTAVSRLLQGRIGKGARRGRGARHRKLRARARRLCCDSARTRSESNRGGRQRSASWPLTRTSRSKSLKSFPRGCRSLMPHSMSFLHARCCITPATSTVHVWKCIVCSNRAASSLQHASM